MKRETKKCEPSSGTRSLHTCAAQKHHHSLKPMALAVRKGNPPTQDRRALRKNLTSSHSKFCPRILGQGYSIRQNLHEVMRVGGTLRQSSIRDLASPFSLQASAATGQQGQISQCFNKVIRWVCQVRKVPATNSSQSPLRLYEEASGWVR